MLEGNIQQDLPITEDVSKDTAQDEKSTADSPPKANPEGARQSPPETEKIDTMDGGWKHDNDVVDDSDNVAKNGEGQPPNDEGEQQQQDHIIKDNT
jgi:hypothetical protein